MRSTIDHQMGCLSSRSSTVSPVDSNSAASKQTANNRIELRRDQLHNGYQTGATTQLDQARPRSKIKTQANGTDLKGPVEMRTSFEGDQERGSLNQSFDGADDDIMSILMTGQTKSQTSGDPGGGGAGVGDKRGDIEENNSINNNNNNNSSRNSNNNNNSNNNRNRNRNRNRNNSTSKRSENNNEDGGIRQGGRDEAKSSSSATNGGGQKLDSSSNRTDSQLEREGPQNNGNRSSASGGSGSNTSSSSNNNNNENNEAGVVALSNQNNEVSVYDDERRDSLDEELNVDLLRQYIAVDFEISQLEDRDALRLYHEKIEQLEQLERELDMISVEAKEIGVRGEPDLSHLERILSSDVLNNRAESKRAPDLESNSIMSGATGSMSAGSSIMRKQAAVSSANKNAAKSQTSERRGQPAKQLAEQEDKSLVQQRQRQAGQQQQTRLEEKSRYSKESNLSYSTIEDVFNRKIILEKERDRLKKEVELVIVECDRLQQRYKKRDEILDKLFDGRTGNGLENHLEQQLIWLMEQKHYVDQVFYAWKRAETLTSQTCEQFASALELLKRLPKLQEGEQRNEVAKSICNLLIKSRHDMEQAQKYNPNVDAPFFTDAETERFDRIIESIKSNSISQIDYNQMATVVQFAYKRAVSIRLWLEQILQITIARDSFELAEEYKWIAIQLRKERISLINSKLQDEPYRSMAQQVREQWARQQHQPQQPHNPLSAANQARAVAQLAITAGKPPGSTNTSNAGENRQNELNRDSGVESDEIDINEDIYRLLELNKGRLEAALAASREAGLPQATALDATGRPINSQPATPAKGGAVARSSTGTEPRASLMVGPLQTGASPADSASQHDRMMRDRIQRRIEGVRRVGSSVVPVTSAVAPLNDAGNSGGGQLEEASLTNDIERRELIGTSQQQKAGSIASAQSHNSAASSTPIKLQIELDEASRQNLLKQVDQIHTKHRNRLDDLRGNNKAKASDFLMNKMQRPNLTGAKLANELPKP